MRRALITAIGSVCYAGYFPIAPATFASFVWLVLYLFVPYGDRLSSPIALIVVVPIAVLIAREMEGSHGDDSSRIVIDEVAGMQGTFLMIEPSLLIGIIGFLLFRIFDIAKPFPINRSQRIGGGFGVVIDDLIAGLYALVVLLALMRFLSLS